MSFKTLLLSLLLSTGCLANGYDVFSIGIYDVKIDNSSSDEAIDYRYERRFDKSILDIGPKEDNFFFLKPFLGIEMTSDSASYFIAGIYLDDNVGDLIKNETNNFIFTPSFGFGYYNDGSGKKLGNSIEFRTSFEVSYRLKDNKRIGLGISHISNANIGDKNPGVEIISFSYHVPF